MASMMKGAGAVARMSGLVALLSIGFFYGYSKDIRGTGLLGAEFSAVPNIFDHKASSTDSNSFFATAPDDPKFGLVLPSFRELHEKVTELRAKGENVKVIYLLRHAEGYHNEAEKAVNDKEHWFGVEGKKEKYLDADLNDAGIAQSKLLSERLARAADLGLRVEHLLTSPLRRAVRTAGIGFNLTDDRRQGALDQYKALLTKKATAVELARETIGQLTCDKRMTRTELQKTFSWVDYSGIEEEDTLWKATERETVKEKKARVRGFLKWLWQHEQLGKDIYFVVATHSGWINAFLRELRVISDDSRWKPANAQMMGLVLKKSDD